MKKKNLLEDCDFFQNWKKSPKFHWEGAEFGPLRTKKTLVPYLLHQYIWRKSIRIQRVNMRIICVDPG